MRLKPILVALAVLIGAAALLSQVATRDAQASISSFTASTTTLNSGGSISLAYLGTDDGSGLNATVTATGATTATLTVTSCNVGLPGHNPAIACLNVPSPGNPLIFDRTNLDTDASETPPGAIEDQLSITMAFTATCNANSTITITADDQDADGPHTLSINCIAATSGGGTSMLGVYQVTVSASPNLLPCQGGTTTITASAFDQTGVVLDGGAFNFYISAGGGLLTQTGADTATLTLGPNQTSATVTASIADPSSQTPKTATVVVSLACGSFSGEANVAVVVTASPNVIQCGGTSTITASGRDPNGHVVAGLGFHFATDVGLLVVQPNDANNENGIATLTLQPGMASATVTVSVGNLLGTVEQTVTVQQFCPGPNVNSSVQPGLLDLNTSSTEVTCGETVFVGASVRDSKVQVVADNTVVNFLATNGQFLNPDGSYQNGTNVALNTLSAPTINGVLNVKYIVGAVQGDVKITAASGDKFGSVILHATCPNPGATGSATSSSGVPAACIPIGNNVCITPPNTGDAGLKK